MFRYFKDRHPYGISTAARARHGFDHDEEHAAEVLPFHCDEDEQILREIYATLNPSVAVSASAAQAPSFLAHALVHAPKLQE